MTDKEVENLVERGMLPQGSRPLYAAPTEDLPEHPTASWLYRRAKAGSCMLTKDEAYSIGNQIDALADRVRALQSGLAEVRRMIHSTLGSLP